jgi:hypothetical protein
MKYSLLQSRRMIFAGHVGCMGMMRNAYKISIRNCDSMRLGRPSMDGKIILKLIFKKQGVRKYTGFN